MRFIVYKDRDIKKKLMEYKLPVCFFDRLIQFCDFIEDTDVIFIQNDLTVIERIEELHKKVNIFLIVRDKKDLELGKGWFTFSLNSSQEELYEKLNSLKYGEFRHIEVKCFGNFELLIDGKVIKISKKKSKEVLAYLVMKRGEPVSIEELSELMFMDNNLTVRNYISVYKYELKKFLKQYQLENLILSKGLRFCVDTSLFYCDYYDFLYGNDDVYSDDFMKQYSWGKTLLEEILD